MLQPLELPLQPAAMASQGGVSAADTCTALYTALQHLASPEGDEQLYHVTARGLHLASRELQTTARRTLRHLRMDRYYNSLVAASGEPSDLFTALPWATLAACPAVTHWTLHPQQLQWFQPEVVDMLDAQAAQLKYLAVHQTSDDIGTWSHRQGLGRLLWACRRLQEVQYQLAGSINARSANRLQEILDPFRNSFSTADLRSLVWLAPTGNLLSCWAQQPHLARSIQGLAVCKGIDVEGLAPLTNIRDLYIGNGEDRILYGVSSLSRLVSLTRLYVWDAAAAVEPACALTGLRSLSLPEGWITELPSSLSQLRQLTHLMVGGGFHDLDLPAELGVWLPRLERLAAFRSAVTVVPSSLTRLSWLSLASCSSSSKLVLPTSLVRLQHLNLSGGSYTSVTGFNTRLHHLDLTRKGYYMGGGCSVLESLQHLTFLGMASIGTDPSVSVKALRFSRPMPALQALVVSGRGHDGLAALAPWVAQLTGLTLLDLSGSELAADEELLFLPAQLKELRLGCIDGLQQVPRGLEQLTAMETLDLQGNKHLCHLPGWLPQLVCLESINVFGTGVVERQEVLAHMPQLRRIRLPDGADRAAVLGRAVVLPWDDRYPTWQSLSDCAYDT